MTRKSSSIAEGWSTSCAAPLAAPMRMKIPAFETRRSHIRSPSMSTKDAKVRRLIPLSTPTDLTEDASRDIAAALNLLLADMFALYVKTKNFHWHVSGPHFRDYHLLLDEQA